MYIKAIIKSIEGKEIKVETENRFDSIALTKFMAKIAKYANKNHKIEKIICDDIEILAFLNDKLPDVKVEYGFKEMLINA
jgi:hypothetical protein